MCSSGKKLERYAAESFGTAERTKIQTSVIFISMFMMLKRFLNNEGFGF